MILITGAGGKTGRAVARLLAQEESLRAFVRRDEQVPMLTSLGAEQVVVGDLRDPAKMRSAMEGIRAVYHVCPNMSPDEVVIGQLVLEEARRAGVGRVVYHSVLHPQTEKMLHHWQKLRVEEMIFESGLPYTILQPAPYMQNWLGSWKSILEEGVLRVPYSVDARFSFVDLEDVAEAAKVVLTQPDHTCAIYELVGTAAMSHVEVAGVLGRVLNRTVRTEQEDIQAWRSNAHSLGLNEYAIENLVRMFTYYDRWGLVGNPSVLRWLLRREPTSLEAFFQRTANDKQIEY